MKDKPDTNAAGQEAARLLRAAGDQIDLALADSQPSVEALGQALQRLADLLSASATGDAQELAELRAELGRAVTSMQYHDRLLQHLSHVRHHMAEGAAHLGAATDVPPHPWAALYEQFATRLLSDAHRERLGRNFPGDFLAQRRASGGSSAPGSDIELF